MLKRLRGQRERSRSEEGAALLDFSEEAGGISQAVEDVEGTDASAAVIADLYTLREVDVSSVRRVGSGHPAPASPPTPARHVAKEPESALSKAIAPLSIQPSAVERELPNLSSRESHQLHFRFSHWGEREIPSWRLEEPIEVLGLSKQAEQGLRELGRAHIGDLLENRACDGLAAGHADEVMNRLSEYLKGCNPVAMPCVELGSLVRTIVVALHTRAASQLLAPYSLESLACVASGTSDRLIESPEVRARMLTRLCSFADAFLLPWMGKRGGISSTLELEERLEAISVDANPLGVIRFLSDLYFPKGIWGELLESADRGVWAVNASVQFAYRRIVECAHTYFYRRGLEYELNELVGYLERELGKGWVGFCDGFVERSLRLAPSLRVYKGVRGRLRVALRFTGSLQCKDSLR